MAWRVVITDTAARDLAHFDDPQGALTEVFDWVRHGPPCDNARQVGPVVMYDQVLASGVKVQYFIGVAPHAYVGVVRLRPPAMEPPS